MPRWLKWFRRRPPDALDDLDYEDDWPEGSQNYAVYWNDMVRRCDYGAVVARLVPKRPMIEWVNGARRNAGKSSATAAQIQAVCFGFYIPEPMEHDEAQAWLLANHWRSLWEMELAQWEGDSRMWPARHHYAFRKWFDLECMSKLVNMSRIVPPLRRDRRKGK